MRTFSKHEGELKIGDATIPCAVLEDGTRVLTTAGVLRSLGRSHGRASGGAYTGVELTPIFLRGKAIKPYISEELASSSRPTLHTYVAAINPPLAETLIKHYVPEGETILDPFCGGGGVLVESILNGRKAIGCDVNPLGALLSKVKTQSHCLVNGSDVRNCTREKCYWFKGKDDVDDPVVGDGIDREADCLAMGHDGDDRF